ncbi:MAG: carbohydrate ABC transporter permease [Rhodospirillales bacterium]|nr:carbohydrate ABC transporter permease [Rhodospirillales bacterium]
MNRFPKWVIHLGLGIICAAMMVPFYWVLKTSLTGENIFAYPPSLVPENPHLFYYVDVWYSIPFFRYLVNSVIVSIIVVVANVVLNAMAGFALTREFMGKGAIIMLFLSCMMIPFQVTIIPAYLITRDIGLLNTHLGMALPLCSTIVCIFVFKASFDAIPKSLIDAARIDGVPDWMIIFRIMVPLSQSAIATNIILAFIWSWNNFLWPLVIIRDNDMQTLPLGLARFLTVVEDSTGALYAFCIMVLVPGLVIFLLAQKQFIAGLTSGAAKG